MDALLLRLSEPLLAYLVHSTLFILAVVLFLRVFPVRSNPLREALWTVALFGGFVTAMLQTGGAVESRTWTLGLERLRPGTSSAHDGVPASRVPRHDVHAPLAATGSVAPSPVGVAPSTSSASSLLERVESMGRFWPIAWIAGVLLAGFALARALVRQRGWLGRRVAVDDVEWQARLAVLKRRLGVAGTVRLSRAEGLASPVAFGVLRPEICVPTRALVELSPAQQDALLAHELAHLRRGDPLRLFLARLAEAIGFFQPLNRLARRRLFEVAEQRCDALAITALGSGMALAECLMEVASWWTAASSAARARPALGMAGSPLATRVEKLLAEDEAVAADRRRKYFAPLLYLALPSLAVLAPAVSVAAIERPTHSAPPTSVPVRVHANPDVAALSLLESEIDALTNEVNELRAELKLSGLDGTFAAEIESLEHRVARLKDRRALLTAWRERLVRGAGLATSPPVDDTSATSPRSQ